MLKLILTRHAKSSWDDPLLYDHDRPLTGRGNNSAKAIGAWMKSSGHLPDHVLTSSATRAQQTAELIAKEVEFKEDFTIEGGLYHASADTMLKQLRKMSRTTILMVGHNPGIADFADRLLANAPSHGRFFDYPTAATLVATFLGNSWSDVQFGTMTAVDFVIPRELIDA